MEACWCGKAWEVIGPVQGGAAERRGWSRWAQCKVIKLAESICYFVRSERHGETEGVFEPNAHALT